MPPDDGQLELMRPDANEGESISVEPLHLCVTFNLAAGGIIFEWTRDDGGSPQPQPVARGQLLPGDFGFARMVLAWRLEFDGKHRNDFCSAHTSSVRALLNRIRKLFP